MKKHFLFFAMAVAAMTSCMKDEVVASYEPAPQAIGFESFVNKTTKAIGSTTTPGVDNSGAVSGLSKFYVHGNYGTTAPYSSVFDEVEVTGAVENGVIKWSYTGGTKYWTANTYHFAAYAQGDNDNAPANVTLTGNIFAIDDVTIPYTTEAETVTTSDAKDLVAALVQTEGTQGRTAPVDFTFKHLLSKIKFTITNTDSQFTMNITDLTITGVKFNGDFSSTTSADWNPSQSEWTTSGEALANFIPIESQPDMDPDDFIESDEFFVLPQGLASVYVNVRADFYDGSDKVFTKTISREISASEAIAWEPGRAYNYTIGLPSAAKPIEIGTVTVGGWGNSVNIELNTDQQ